MNKIKKILIIDDEENIRSALKRMLRASMPSVEVVETGNSEHSLAIVKKCRPDLILLDVLMPKVNGLTLLKALKKSENSETRKIPVIMISGVGNREVNIKAKKMGAVDYVTKPFNYKVFLLKIRKYMKINQKSFIKNGEISKPAEDSMKS